MKFWKLGLALSLTATFGILGCNETTSANDSDDRINCEVKSDKDTVIIKSNEEGFDVTVTYFLKGNKMIATAEFGKDPSVDICEKYKTDNDYVDVKCTEKSVTATSKDSMDAKTFELYTSFQMSACKAMDGKKFEDLAPKKKETKKDSTEAAKDSTNANTGDEGDATEACKEGDKTSILGISMICKNGKLTLDLPECNESNKEKEEILVADIKVVCDGTKWRPAIDKCTEEKEGEIYVPEIAGTKFEQFSFTCTDGNWESNFESEDDAADAVAGDGEN